ncbi:MAG TPA: GAF domain-containing protein [Actinoallomurus sp.]|nr:GAF domain-containing protein [Actinoallomurus sp.]
MTRSSQAEKAIADCDRRPPVIGTGASNRLMVADSWRRSLAAGVDPDLPSAPLVFDADALAGFRECHPLDRHLPMLRETLRGVADASAHLMVVTDAEGHVLWSEGPRAVRRRADRVGLAEGFRWAEESVGTNGMGTALSVGGPVHIQATEHLIRVLHAWSCVAAPITDPDTGKVIGCVDITGAKNSMHPAVIALVQAAARLTEAQLTLEMHRRDEHLRARYFRHLHGDASVLVTATGRILAADPDGWRDGRVAVPEAGHRVTLPDGRTAVAEVLGQAFVLRAVEDERSSLMLRLLGHQQPHAFLDGRRIPLSLRHAELLALMALHPSGLTCEQSSFHLYGDEGNPVTVRAEIHRLRAQLGDVVRAKPYRLDCDVDADFLTVRRLLGAGNVTAAVRLYPGPLLPRSESAAIQSERDDLNAQLRRQLLHHGDIDALWAYAQTGEDDLEILGRLMAVLPPGDPRRVAAQLREHRVMSDG